MRRFIKLSVVPAAAVLALSGCGAHSNHRAAGPQTESASLSPTTSSTTLDGDGGLKNATGAIKELQGVKCAPDSHGNWSATATIQNGAATKGRYLVQFAVVKQHSEVVGSGSKTVTVAAGKSAAISLPKLYSGSQKGLICVPRVLRGTA